ISTSRRNRSCSRSTTSSRAPRRSAASSRTASRACASSRRTGGRLIPRTTELVMVTQSRGRAVTQRRFASSLRIKFNMPRILLAFLVLLSPFPLHARTRVVASKLDSARRILVITSHPDDELLLAPLLAQRCITGGASCSFVVMTMGEGGGDGATRAGE